MLNKICLILILYFDAKIKVLLLDKDKGLPITIMKILCQNNLTVIIK
tara:strand:+ start:90 stop:230 length:141 start_codon:yes stop_codon:yes gene_type:complete